MKPKPAPNSPVKAQKDPAPVQTTPTQEKPAREPKNAREKCYNNTIYNYVQRPAADPVQANHTGQATPAQIIPQGQPAHGQTMPQDPPSRSQATPQGATIPKSHTATDYGRTIPKYRKTTPGRIQTTRNGTPATRPAQARHAPPVFHSATIPTRSQANDKPL